MKTAPLRLALALACLVLALAPGVSAQSVYRNVVNQPFATVGDGPQSAIIVDVDDPRDPAAVQQAVDAAVGAAMRSRAPALQREVALLRACGALKPGQQIPVVDEVLLRSHGQLVGPPASRLTRAPGPGNSLSFVAATSGQYAFDVPTASALDSVTNNLFYPELARILGPPLWTGANGQPGLVNILNKDDNPTLVSGILGVVVVNNAGTINIDLPQFRTQQDTYLGLLQAMAQCFHGPLALGYDAWEKGMARAAAVVSARDLQGQFPGGAAVDPTGAFCYTPYYDVLNQPALGNSTFLPPTKSSETLTGLGGMLVPRLEMSATAWLKCYIENPQFFVNFNAAYYDAYQADPAVASDVNRLRVLASQAVGGTVEGQPFALWFQQQYVLDTSIIPGPKEYCFVQPTSPDSTHPEDGATITVVYYMTINNGDEVDLSGSSNPVFWDFTYQNRLTLSGADTALQIVSGEGTTAPYFTNIGEQPSMRIAMDFPIGGSNQRVFFPANEDTTTSAAFNDIYGVTVGSDTGLITATFTGGNGAPVSIPVSQGAFGAIGGASVPNNFTQITLSYQPASGGAPIVYKRNVYQRVDNANNSGMTNVSSVFVLVAPAPTETLTHVFQAGPQLISLPIHPLNPDLAAVFGLDPNATLLAQWRQDSTGGPDHYLRYPSLPLYQPGYGLWTNFQGALNGGSGSNGIPIVGESTDEQPVISAGLQYGWNQIGDPFQIGVNITTDGSTGTQGGLQFQYQGGDTVTLSQAVQNGWLAAGIFGYDPASGSYVDITQSSPTGGFQANTLETWKGYWILVTVPEGLTLTYVNPSPTTRALYRHTRAPSQTVVRGPGRNSWAVQLLVEDGAGRASQVTVGESQTGSDGYVSSLDAALPPPITAAPRLQVRLPHADWNAGPTRAGDFLSDVRPAHEAATWNIAVDVPHAQQSYTLRWAGLAKVPRNQDLTLVDLDTGSRVALAGTPSYSFTPGKGETTRRFQLVAQPQTSAWLAIAGLEVLGQPAPGGRAPASAAISFQLTRAAEISIEILGPNGRAVRHLTEGRALAAGPVQVTWDLRDDAGRGLPSGAYMASVSARAPDGRLTRAAMPYIVTR